MSGLALLARLTRREPQLRSIGMMTTDEKPPITEPALWVDRYGDPLYRYAQLRVRAADIAADLVQETFLEALRSKDSFAGRSSEWTWLVGILKHKVLDHLRKACRERSLRNGVLHGRDAAFDSRGFWRTAPRRWAGDPSQDIEKQEFWDVFSHCLSELSAGLADAFFLREVVGLSPDEVRSILGITPENLWARLHRARLVLRRCLETKWFLRPITSRRSKGPS
jgi:RNA polymerase sigma-70 factor, ECF subfamily